ncbi:hypothetical protein ACOSQ3_012681 [Xanthoceras sorbifolium]
MSSPIDNVLKEIDLYKGSPSPNGKSMDSGPRPLAILKKLLSEESLRPSRLWSRIDKNAEGTPFPRLKDLVTYVYIQQGFELLCGTQFLTLIYEVKRKFALDYISNLKPHVPTADEALKRRREKALASVQKKKELKRKKVDREKDDKLEELKKREDVLVTNVDRYCMEQKPEIDNLLREVSALIEKYETIAGDAIIQIKAELIKEYK